VVVVVVLFEFEKGFLAGFVEFKNITEEGIFLCGLGDIVGIVLLSLYWENNSVSFLLDVSVWFLPLLLLLPLDDEA